MMDYVNKIERVCVLFVICFFVVCKVDAQNSSFKSSTNKYNSDTLVYLLVGDGCPACNIHHPEKKFGFIIECVGCMRTKEVTANNLEVVQRLDIQYGKGWTEKYMREYLYCQIDIVDFRDSKILSCGPLKVDKQLQLDSIRVYEIYDSNGISILKGKDKSVDVSSLKPDLHYLVLDETEMKEFIKK